MADDLRSTLQATLVERVGPLLLLLLAFALYTFRLDAQSLWYDEAVSARLASMPLPDLIRWTANDIQPPLYYILLHGWTRAAGTSEWALRFFSAWWGVLVVALGYTLARRLTRSRGAATLTALLFTLTPWNVYYSQEARMYTLLLALSMALALVLTVGNRTRGWRVAFGVLALALLYTHYFALFLLIAFSVAVGMGWVGRGGATPKRHRGPTGVGQRLLVSMRPLVLPWGIIGVGYLPWLPFLLTRFREDASYWGGTLKVHEALRHWWVHMTLGAPETFLEKAAIRWLPLFVGVTVVVVGWGVVTVLRRHEGQHDREVGARLAWLLTWFLLPPALILFLAYRSPKFNPRYLMLAYPAWLLLLTLPLARRHASPWTRLLAGSLPLLVLPLFARADLAWFTDPAFTKPDFRGAIAYIRAHRTPNEPVFLISGHMSPVFDYYAPDIPRLRLPDIDVLDVNRVLGFEVAKDINRAIAGADGVWLLLWQDEVVDPMGVVPYLLSLVGEEDPRVPNAFWHVRVRHYRLPPGARVPESPPVEHPVRVNWENMVELLGYAQHGDRVALFFRPLQKINEDLRLHLEVWDEDGFFWGQADARPGPYMYPTTRWQVDKVILGLHPLPLVDGAPAGTYTLRVRLYSDAQPNGLDMLDAAGNPAGKDALLPGLIVNAPRPLTAVEGQEPGFPPLPPTSAAANILTYTLSYAMTELPTLDAVRLWPTPPWEPGQRVYAQLRWRLSRAPREDDVFSLVLLNRQEHYPLVEKSLSAREGQDRAWPSGAWLFSQVRFRVPRDVPPGTWTLAARVKPAETDVQHVQSIAKVDVRPSARVFEVPRVRYPVGAVFGDALRLVGVDTTPEAFRPGARAPITLTWQSVQEVDVSYTAFVHLLGPDGRILAQEDHIPCRGGCPTDGWIAGEVIRDRYDLTLPADMPESGLILEVGVYDASRPGFPRLKVADTGQSSVLLPITP